jgi:predicted DsbA family dithiol-disulfide isomerase
MSSPLIIDYYSDVLCVWAWIAQRRIEELRENWGDDVVLRHHYMNLFGDTEARIGQGWADKGGFEGFGQHVIAATAPYDEAPVIASIWCDAKPATSGNAHLLIKAAELAHGAQTGADLALAIRKEFFTHGKDVGNMAVLMDIADDIGIDADRLEEILGKGQAMANLMADYKDAQEQNLKGSPTWIMNGGRQVLYGNVGYRVLHANIEEILHRPDEEASWC